MRIKEAKEIGYKEGVKAYGKFTCAPAANAEFIEMLPKGYFSDESVIKIRVVMMKGYIKGWTFMHLNSEKAFDCLDLEDKLERLLGVV